MDDIFPDPKKPDQEVRYWVKALIIGGMAAIAGAAWAVFETGSLIPPTLLAFPTAAIIISEHLKS